MSGPCLCSSQPFRSCCNVSYVRLLRTFHSLDFSFPRQPTDGDAEEKVGYSADYTEAAKVIADKARVKLSKL